VAQTAFYSGEGLTFLRDLAPRVSLCDLEALERFDLLG